MEYMKMTVFMFWGIEYTLKIKILTLMVKVFHKSTSSAREFTLVHYPQICFSKCCRNALTEWQMCKMIDHRDTVFKQANRVIQLQSPQWASFSCSDSAVWRGVSLCRAWVLLFGRRGIPHIPAGFEQLYVCILTLPSNCGCLTEPSPPLLPPPPGAK